MTMESADYTSLPALYDIDVTSSQQERRWWCSTKALKSRACAFFERAARLSSRACCLLLFLVIQEADFVFSFSISLPAPLGYRSSSFWLVGWFSHSLIRWTLPGTIGLWTWTWVWPPPQHQKINPNQSHLATCNPHRKRISFRRTQMGFASYVTSTTQRNFENCFG